MSTAIATKKPTNKIIYGLIYQGELDKEAEISDFTRGRHSSLGELSEKDKDKLIKHLRQKVKDKLHPMRAKIIHRMALMGYTKNAKPDYDRINADIKAIGTNNPRKAPLLGLRYSELQKVTTQIDARYRRTKKAKK